LLDDYLTAPDGCRNYPWPTQRASGEFPFLPAHPGRRIAPYSQKAGNKNVQVGTEDMAPARWSPILGKASCPGPCRIAVVGSSLNPDPMEDSRSFFGGQRPIDRTPGFNAFDGVIAKRTWLRLPDRRYPGPVWPSGKRVGCRPCRGHDLPATAPPPFGRPRHAEVRSPSSSGTKLSPSRMSKKYRTISAVNVRQAKAFLAGLVGHPDGAGDQAIQRDPGRIPAFHGLATHRALEARDLPRLRHVLGPAIDRPAIAGSVIRLFHPLLWTSD
jgi:hypothetical protein